MNDIITLLDEMGNEKEFKVLATFGLNDMDYAALLPLEDLDELTYLLRIEYDDQGQPMLVGIDDDEELEYVIKAYEEIQNEKLQ
ncbi:MAG: DUF1292 domain-containing protein [Tissierellia bacterium]|nr:DUF1292 domain-containing protein [Tissierellia bacterium]